jgi:hypothetical protein
VFLYPAAVVQLLSLNRINSIISLPLLQGLSSHINVASAWQYVRDKNAREGLRARPCIQQANISQLPIPSQTLLIRSLFHALTARVDFRMKDGHAAFNLACQRTGLGCFWPESASNHHQDSQAHRATLDFSSDPPFPLNGITHLRSQDDNKAFQMLSTAASALDWESAKQWAARHHAQVTTTELALVKSFMTKHISKLTSDANLGVASMVAAATEAIEDPVLQNVDDQEEHHVVYPLQGVKFLLWYSVLWYSVSVC